VEIFSVFALGHGGRRRRPPSLRTATGRFELGKLGRRIRILFLPFGSAILKPNFDLFLFFGGSGKNFKFEFFCFLKE
jgi:hypothetical protein